MTYIDLTGTNAFPGSSANLRGYLATPAGPGPFPGVVMIHEAFGLDANSVRHAERLAAAGYLTLAVDLYSDGGSRRCLVATMQNLLSGTGRAFADIATTRKWLKDSDLSTGSTGVIGFCMGGGFALLVANDGYDAAAVNYGKLPAHPEEVLRGACPIVANYGAKDKSLKGAPAKLAAALEGLGVEHDVKEFPHAGHAFLNQEEAGPVMLRPLMRVMGIGPDPESAPEAWQRIEDHFGRHLKTPPAAPI